MKLDLIEINKLSPPGLWDLRDLLSVIAMLRSAIASGTGRSLFFYGRLMMQYSENLREKKRENLNMRIKAWVLQCPVRAAHVRGIIGAVAIGQWRKNRLADYALTKYFGDWRRKWPNGFTNPDGFINNDTKLRRQTAPKFTCQPRAYKWKLFALVKIVNVRKFLFCTSKPDFQSSVRQESEMQDAYYKLWGVDILQTGCAGQWTTPRGARSFKPIRFTPYELELDELEVEPEEAKDLEQITLTVQDAPKRIKDNTQTETKSGEPPPDKKPP